MRHRTFYVTCSVGSTEAQLLLFLSDPSTPWHKYFTGGGTNISEAFHYPRGQHKPTRTPSLPPKKTTKNYVGRQEWLRIKCLHHFYRFILMTLLDS